MRTFIIIFILIGFYVPGVAQSEHDSMYNFMLSHKKDLSIYLQVNDTAIATLNEEKLMPLASTVKILVDIEFAKQASAQVISISDGVALSELDYYHLPGTDGGAHLAWLNYEKARGHIYNDSVSLLDVARGMMMFSSNANTEYLMDLLGLDNVKNNIPTLGIKKHTPVFPIVSSLFLYQNPRNIEEKKLLKSIEGLSDEMYSRYIYDIHKALKYSDSLKPKFRPNDLTMPMQKLWSSRLPASTTKDYVRLARILNNRKFLSNEAYDIIAKTMETVMENAANKKQFRHAGMKGGSTAFVLTKTLYATMINGDRIEMAYFFNNLNPVDNMKIQMWMNAFEYNILTNTVFRDKFTNSFLPDRKKAH